MFTIYVLFSPSFNKIYIGYTSDIANRIISHNELATKGYTIKYRPWVIAYTEEYATKTEALKRENYLKSTQGRKFAWEIICKKFDNSDG
ncbi:MAG: GIY-YIG nuclease family protein [Sphingobacteriaceae bacterium]|nr:MAG: GIY-YIG nuclease family protein [Sphingobacteriaceae bacterium]